MLIFDPIANMHFGFVGRAAGFGENLLIAGAGVAQVRRAPDTGNPDDWGMWDCWGDHPFATWSIKFGSYLYGKYANRLDELIDEALAQALTDYISEHGEPPDPPPSALPH
jgi:hypothetical protein